MATLHGERLGRLPGSDSYDQVFDPGSGDSPWIGATYRYNATLQYRIGDHAQLSLAAAHLFDEMPPRDRGMFRLSTGRRHLVGAA